jgi:hypothetical protein
MESPYSTEDMNTTSPFSVITFYTSSLFHSTVPVASAGSSASEQPPNTIFVLMVCGGISECYGNEEGCRCYERLKDKTGGSKSLAHTRWSEGRGYLRRGKRIGDAYVRLPPI